MFKGYTLRYDELFEAQLNAIASARHMDEALIGVEWILSNEPEKCPVVPGTTRLRVIKTEPYRRNLVEIPALRIWFSIEDGGIVLMRAIDVIEDWDAPDNQ